MRSTIEKAIIAYFEQLHREGEYIIIRDNKDIYCDVEFTPEDLADKIAIQLERKKCHLHAG
jgi:hypothetical protein